MNISLFIDKVDHFHCEINNAYGAIVCARNAGQSSDNKAFNSFCTELYRIEYYLQLLNDDLNKQAAILHKNHDEQDLIDIFTKLVRVHELFIAHVSEAACNENTTILHRCAIGAAFAAFNIISGAVDEFSLIIKGNDTAQQPIDDGIQHATSGIE